MVDSRKFSFSLALVLLFTVEGPAQLGMFSKEQRIEFTREWKGERFPDGRPRVPGEVLERLKNTTAEEAWAVLSREDYHYQFEGGWRVINEGPRMVGRVVTALFMPERPDVNAVISDFGRKEGRPQVGLQNAWVIETLVQGDVLVVDLFGKIEDGTFAGDNLSTAIFTRTGKGLIVDGAVRDVSGIREIEGFQCWVRDAHPSVLRGVTLMGINVPTRIGGVTVMPGDVVLTDPEGLTFIPAQLAEKVADYSELTQLQDRWGKQMLREGRFSSAQVDGRWTREMIEEFSRWAEERGAKVRMKVE